MKRPELGFAAIREDVAALRRAIDSPHTVLSPGFFDPESTDELEVSAARWEALKTDDCNITLSLPHEDTEAALRKREQIAHNLRLLRAQHQAREAELASHSFELLCSLVTQETVEFLLSDGINYLDLFNKRPLFAGNNSNPPRSKRLDLFVIVEDIATKIEFHDESEFPDVTLGMACTAVKNAVLESFKDIVTP